MSELIYFQDLTKLSDPSPSRIGGKGMGLLQLHELGLLLLPSWVLPPEVFSTFISSLKLDRQLELLNSTLGSEPHKDELEAVRNAILAAPLPEGLLVELNVLQKKWRREFGDWIIVRSSATVEDSERSSFAGIFESIPCQTDQEIEIAIRKVWASVFSLRAFTYYGIASLKQIPAMALILQPFVEANRSGVMFTRFDRPNQDPMVLIEHVEGGGEKLVTGQVNPDRFWMPRWPVRENNALINSGTLDEGFALQLAQVAQYLEHKLDVPQDVEWCVQDERLYILQTRPITSGGWESDVAFSGEVLLQGVGASSGRAIGDVHLVFNIEDADTLQLGEVLTTNMTNPDMVPSMQRSAAVVTDVGGMICHAAIVSRELGIPCVVGTKSATQILVKGTQVTVDGSSGVIYRGHIRLSEEALPARNLQWSDLWLEWQIGVSKESIPVLSTSKCLSSMPGNINSCVIDPFCDLSLDPRAEIYSLDSMEDVVLNELLGSYVEQLNTIATLMGLHAIYLDLHRLGAETQNKLIALIDQKSPINPLKHYSDKNPWKIQITRDGNKIALLDGYFVGDQIPLGLTHELLEDGRRDAIMAIPLGLGGLIGKEQIQTPGTNSQNPAGMFGMMPEIRMARMPARECREAMHQLIPVLSRIHGGHVPQSEQALPWLDLRPEVLITPFLKAFVTPGVEIIPFVLGFDDPPLYIQFIRCRFHFRQDTLFGFFPKLMQATWDESFMSSMLQRCRSSYLRLEELSDSLYSSEEDLTEKSQKELRDRFVAWWNAFSDFFSLSFFIQAQGDDCIFPALDSMAQVNESLLENDSLEWRIPGLAELSAPVTPVLTTEYMQDLLELKQRLNLLEIEGSTAAEQVIESGAYPELNLIFERVYNKWYWMRERDPYYDPYDNPAAILEKVLAIRSMDPPDFYTNQAQAELALALHFDLGRLMGNSEKLVYAIKYGRALVIDRENHHVVWLRTSYKVRKLLLEWERQLAARTDLQPRDIFFLQPWEILDAVAALPQPLSGDLLARVRNRRVAYEREIQIKAGRDSNLTPYPEEDYY